MGLAIAGQVVNNLAIAGVKPSGLAVNGVNVWSGVPPMEWSLVTFIRAAASTPTVTSLPIDTTQADLLVLIIANQSTLSPNNFSDTGNNTWIQTIAVGYSPLSQMFYCPNPTTSPSHIFIASGSGILYCSFIILAFKVTGAFVIDQMVNSLSSSGQITNQLPAITPVYKSLVVAGLSCNNSGVIDSNFTLVQSVGYSSGAYGSSSAYLITTSESSVSPIWTLSATNYASAATMISFKPA